jgi:molecular chaperone HtpG
VSDEGEMSGTLQRLLKQAGQKAPESRPILEINPAHPLVARMKGETQDTQAWASLLFDQAQLAEGAQLEDPAGFVKRLNGMLMSLSRA